MGKNFKVYLLRKKYRRGREKLFALIILKIGVFLHISLSHFSMFFLEVYQFIKT